MKTLTSKFEYKGHILSLFSTYWRQSPYHGVDENFEVQGIAGLTDDEVKKAVGYREDTEWYSTQYSNYVRVDENTATYNTLLPYTD